MTDTRKVHILARMEGMPPARTAAWNAWTEWKRRCALALCGKPEADALLNFADRRFALFLGRARGAGAVAAELPARDAWHLFESHLLLSRSRRGTRYKDWMFDRLAKSGDDPLDVIQGGATLIMRDVVRRYVLAERPGRRALSLQTALAGESGDRLTLEDLLRSAQASPADAAAEREYEALSERHAREFFAAAGRRERLLLLAREAGVPLSHPAVTRAAGCRKSAASEVWRGFLVRVVRRLRTIYAGEERECVMRLALLTLQRLAALAGEWGRGDGAAAQILAATHSLRRCA